MDSAQIRDLLEEFTPDAEEIVRELDDGTMPAEDLMQEAMLGIVEALNALPEDRDEWEARSLDEIVRSAVREAVLRARDANAELACTDLRLVAQVELLNKSIDRLTEESGMKPNIDEIANDMQISQAKVLEILKLTGESLDDEAFIPRE